MLSCCAAFDRLSAMYLPGAHSMQLDSETAPSPSKYFPESQMMQSLRLLWRDAPVPGSVLYLPAIRPTRPTETAH